MWMSLTLFAVLFVIFLLTVVPAWNWWQQRRREPSNVVAFPDRSNVVRVFTPKDTA